MKTIEQQIEVMQHFANGGEVEYFSRAVGWTREKCPSWNWSRFNYRIKEVVDPYAELKTAAADPTKQIRLRTCKTWHDAGHDWKFDAPVDQYEIRNKPRKVKLLAWFDGYKLDWIYENAPVMERCERVPAEDKEIEVEE